MLVDLCPSFLQEDFSSCRKRKFQYQKYFFITEKSVAPFLLQKILSDQ